MIVIKCYYLFIVCVFVNVLHISCAHLEEGLELLFRQRTQSDWEDAWHQESHSRCRDKLVRHLFWACDKDIYRLSRRTSHAFEEGMKKRTTVQRPWLQPMDNTFLRTRRSRAAGVSITNECCTKVGCTWEEYAEYCPSNKRKNHYRT